MANIYERTQCTHDRIHFIIVNTETDIYRIDLIDACKAKVIICKISQFRFGTQTIEHEIQLRARRFDRRDAVYIIEMTWSSQEQINIRWPPIQF